MYVQGTYVRLYKMLFDSVKWQLRRVHRNARLPRVQECTKGHVLHASPPTLRCGVGGVQAGWVGWNIYGWYGEELISGCVGSCSIFITC